MKYLRWTILALFAATALAQSSPVYNYFPPPGIAYSTTTGMVLGSAAGAGFGPGTLNVQGLYVNGVPVGSSTGTVTSVSVVSANGLSGSVANPTTAAAITLAPTFTGIGYSTGSGLQAAVAGNFPTLNQSTTGNAATATLAAAATALASTPALCSSGQAAQGILANGNATGCITPFSVVNESANTLFAGPASGTPALPSFRGMVDADLPLSSSPTWTGSTTMAPASGVGLAINGNASNDALDVTNGLAQYTKVIGSSTTGSSNGLLVTAGTNSSDVALEVKNRAGTTSFFRVLGDGTVGISDSAGNGLFQVGYLGTPLNVQGGSYPLTLADRGKTVELDGSSGTVTIPSGVFSGGDVITILALNGTTSFTIAPAGGVTLYWAIGNVTSGSRTLTSVGLATILCVNSTTFVISGSGIT
jgi:hypothetical protein